MTQKPELTGKRVFLYFLAFFGFITCVLAGLAFFAVRTHTGIVTQNPYEKGLAYNSVVKADEAQAELGWQAVLDFAKTADTSGHVTFKLKDKAAKPLTGAAVKLELFRPTQSGVDFTVPLSATQDGVYEADVKFPLQGMWEMRVFAEKDKNIYQIAKRITLQ